MNSFNRKKRAPFGDAPADVGNRKARATLPTKAAGSINDSFKRRIGPPASSKVSKPASSRGSAPVPGVLVKSGVKNGVKNGARNGARNGAKNGARSKSRPRQQLDPPQQQSPQRSIGSTSTADAHVNPSNDATRARVYKAEAYEAKIRLASQEQRIKALQSELEEVKFFQAVESNEGCRNKSSEEARETEKKSRDDAELIEALAQECETMEKDLKTSQTRIKELEKGLMASSKRSMDEVAWETRKAELEKKLESQQKELNKSKKDTTQGIKIIQELDSALRAARAERDDARTQLSNQCIKTGKGHELEEALKSMQKERDEARTDLSSSRQGADALAKTCKDLEQSNETLKQWNEELHHKIQEQMIEEKKSEAALKSMQNQRDQARSDLLSSRQEVDALTKTCAGLEQSNESLEQSNGELQNVLATVQSQSGKKMEQIKTAILEARSREDNLKLEYKELEVSYEQQVKESQKMESALEGMAKQFEAQQEKLLEKVAAMKELSISHSADIVNLKQQHSEEILEIKENEIIVSSLEARHAQELELRESYMKDYREKLTNAQRRNKEFEAAASNYVSEIEAMKRSLKELEKSSNIETQAHGDLQLENSKLKADKDDLSRKLQRGLEIHKNTTVELEAKTLELENLLSLYQAAQIEKEFTDTLKKDYSIAVTLSIERGKKIQGLEKDAETYKSQVAKLIHKIKKMEKKSETSIGANKQLESEVSSLRERVRESETAQEQGSCQPRDKSRTEQLERDLIKAQKENNASQTQILNLQEALRDVEAALKAVSSRKFSPHKCPSPTGHEEKRRHVEDGALKEYLAHRIQTGK